jgi:hypothetical protein
MMMGEKNLMFCDDNQGVAVKNENKAIGIA